MTEHNINKDLLENQDGIPLPKMHDYFEHEFSNQENDLRINLDQLRKSDNILCYENKNKVGLNGNLSYIVNQDYKIVAEEINTIETLSTQEIETFIKNRYNGTQVASADVFKQDFGCTDLVKITFNDGSTYTGVGFVEFNKGNKETKNLKLDGPGIFCAPKKTLTIIGDFHNGEITNNMKCYMGQPYNYIGTCQKNQLNTDLSLSLIVRPTGVYIGSININLKTVNDYPSKGTIKFDNNDTFEGTFEAGKIGKGIYTFKNGEKIIPHTNGNGTILGASFTDNKGWTYTTKEEIGQTNIPLVVKYPYGAIKDGKMIGYGSCKAPNFTSSPGVKQLEVEFIAAQKVKVTQSSFYEKVENNEFGRQYIIPELSPGIADYNRNIGRSSYGCFINQNGVQSDMVEYHEENGFGYGKIENSKLTHGMYWDMKNQIIYQGDFSNDHLTGKNGTIYDRKTGHYYKGDFDSNGNLTKGTYFRSVKNPCCDDYNIKQHKAFIYTENQNDANPIEANKMLLKYQGDFGEDRLPSGKGTITYLDENGWKIKCESENFGDDKDPIATITFYDKEGQEIAKDSQIPLPKGFNLLEIKGFYRDKSKIGYGVGIIQENGEKTNILYKKSTNQFLQTKNIAELKQQPEKLAQPTIIKQQNYTPPGSNNKTTQQQASQQPSQILSAYQRQEEFTKNKKELAWQQEEHKNIRETWRVQTKLTNTSSTLQNIGNTYTSRYSTTNNNSTHIIQQAHIQQKNSLGQLPLNELIALKQNKPPLSIGISKELPQVNKPISQTDSLKKPNEKNSTLKVVRSSSQLQKRVLTTIAKQQLNPQASALLRPLTSRTMSVQKKDEPLSNLNNNPNTLDKLRMKK